MIETYYRILKHDSEGKLVKDTGLIESHSYVIQFLELVGGILDGGGGVTTATDVTGAESTIVKNVVVTNITRVDAPVNDDTYGIVVGTNAGVTAEDNENYSLDTKILHSAVVAANKLNYRAVTFIAPRLVGANIDLDITRPFINETGGGITVKEIGLICKNSSDTKYHLLLRDVVADELVADAETLTVVYVLRTTA